MVALGVGSQRLGLASGVGTERSSWKTSASVWLLPQGREGFLQFTKKINKSQPQTYF